MILLRQLVPAGEKRRLAHVLSRILGEGVCLLDESGEWFIGDGCEQELHPVFFNRQEIAHIGARGSSPESRILATEVLEALLSAWAWSGVQEHALRQRYQAEKLAAVGRLAAGIAHEINNPAAYVHSNLQTALRYNQLLSELIAPVLCRDWAGLVSLWQQHHLEQVLSDFPELLAESLKGIERIGHVVRDLRLFSCVDRSNADVVDLNELLNAVAQIIRRQLSVGQTLQLDLQPLTPIPCLPGYLNQTFLEIMTNARQALNDSPEGRIMVSSQLRDDRVIIRIEDNGVGMTQDLQEHVFEPFFTTRDPSDGTGLGLTVARDIILAHDGQIDIDSIPGRGTTVLLSLPGA